MGRLLDSLLLNGDVDLYLTEAVKNNTLEFEWIYGDINYLDKKPLTKESFLRLKDHLDGSTTYTSKSEVNTLDIRTEFRNKGKSVMSNVRATVTDLSNIKKYCIQDNVEGLPVTYILKQPYRDPNHPSTSFSSVGSGLYPFRVNLKKELPLHASSEEVVIFSRNWTKKNKFFRFKKRFS